MISLKIGAHLPTDESVRGFLGVRWTVGRKLGLAFGGVVCFLIGVSIVALHAIGSLASDHDRAMAQLPAMLDNRAVPHRRRQRQLPRDRQLDPPADRPRDDRRRAARDRRRDLDHARAADARAARPRASSTWRDDDVRGLADGLEAVANGDMTVEVTTSTRPIQRISSDEIGEVSPRRQRDPRHRLDVARRLQRMRAARRRDPRARSRTAPRASPPPRSRWPRPPEEAGRAVGEIATPSARSRSGAERQVRSVEEARELTDEVAAATQQSAGRRAGDRQRRAAGARGRRRGRRAPSTQATEAMPAVARRPRPRRPARSASWARSPSRSAASSTRSPASPSRPTCWR